MNINSVPIHQVKVNPNNPRIIKDDKFHKLVKSIESFPEMLAIRPIVVNKDMIVLGGNMRLKACEEAGLKFIPVLIADDLTEEQQREFIIKDNIGFGQWDWELIANNWDIEQITDWGLDVPYFDNEKLDYSVLEDSELDEKASELTDGVKKAIQIEFEPEHYQDAYELVKFWRERKAYVGGMLMEYLKEERNKLK